MMPVFAPQVGHLVHLGDTGLEEEATPVDQVVFFETPEEKESNMATVIKAVQEAATAEPVKVKVVENFRVVHEGKPYVGGDVVEIPAELASLWIKSKWVALVPVSKKASA
jgi:hypothetical protein